MRLLAIALGLCASFINACETVSCKLNLAPENNPDLTLIAANVTYLEDVDQVVFEMTVAGTAGNTAVVARKKMDGAPVLAYVFPTTLTSTDVGFSATEGIVALGITVHPDFDDSPLWDENGDGVFDNDGGTWHAHWVILTKDDRVPGGLAVKDMAVSDTAPTTAPKMPIFMDSPGFTIVRRGPTLRAIVPAARISRKLDFSYDAVTAYLAVNAPGTDHTGPSALPMLGVYKVYSVLSGTLTLPYRVER